MKRKPLSVLFFIFIIFIFLFAVLFAVIIKSENLTFLEGRAINVVGTESPMPQPTPAWSLLDKILEPDPGFDNIELKIGDKDISYLEERYLRDENGNITFDGNGQIRKEKIVRNDPEREIGLKLLNFKTGTTEIIKIKKHGDKLIAPIGYDIGVYERLSGISWNAHNTYYNIRMPADLIVIRNVWPEIKYETQSITVTERGKKKKKKVRMPVLEKNKSYIPYSDSLRTSEIVDKGIKDLKQIVTEAKKRLRKKNVMSRAFPDRLVADVLPDAYYWRRPLIEHSDLGEFVIDPKGAIERIFVILATNESSAWSSCNFASACGIYQFTRNTYNTITKSYSDADLIKEFNVGSLDHINSAMAAILLDDTNLAGLISSFGEKIYRDPNLNEYIYAAYNGNPKWAYKSLSATIYRASSKKPSDWIKHLKPETKGAMLKVRYLEDNQIP